MKTTRRDFLSYSATTTAVVGSGLALNTNANNTAAHPNQLELDRLSALPFASAAMPAQFSIAADISAK
ncbi:ubiquinol-cytochrome c reductase iron-sulfur subunit N-terminal domain-containing protein [Oceanicoccus sagamiensis]|nr:ubiquinol-cytochrome c reductase iron-sulfur subunit N-terminal domain-containing protein [Oceanicoccus sagamiensis]